MHNMLIKSWGGLLLPDKLFERTIDHFKVHKFWPDRRTTKYTLINELKRVACTVFYDNKSKLKIYYNVSNTDEYLDHFKYDTQSYEYLKILETFKQHGWVVNAEFTIAAGINGYLVLDPIKLVKSKSKLMATAHKKDVMVKILCAYPHSKDIYYKCYVKLSKNNHVRLMHSTSVLIDAAKFSYSLLSIDEVNPINFDAYHPRWNNIRKTMISNNAILAAQVVGFASLLNKDGNLLVINDTAIYDPNNNPWVIISTVLKHQTTSMIATCGDDNYYFVDGRRYLCFIERSCYTSYDFSPADLQLLQLAINNYLHELN